LTVGSVSTTSRITFCGNSIEYRHAFVDRRVTFIWLQVGALSPMMSGCRVT